MEIFVSYICNMEMFFSRAAFFKLILIFHWRWVTNVIVVKSHSFVHIRMISVCANSVLRPPLKSQERNSGNETVSVFVIDLHVYCVQWERQSLGRRCLNKICVKFTSDNFNCNHGMWPLSEQNMWGESKRNVSFNRGNALSVNYQIIYN